MKGYLMELLFGLLVIVLVLATQFVVTMPFTEVADAADPVRWKALIDRELLLASLPVLLITFLLSLARRGKSPREGVLRGAIWGCCVLVFYIVIGIQNGSLELIFGSLGLYTLLLCTFAGPVIQGGIGGRSGK